MQEFDPTDPKNLGRPLHFDLSVYAEAIIGMIRADEIQLAMHMLDNPPAYYREHYPPELEAIRATLYRNAYDQIEYATDDDEFDMANHPTVAVEQWLGNYCYPRGALITAEVVTLNSQGKSPWILDVGCSHGNLPLGLMHLQAGFTYCGKAMNYRAMKTLKDRLGDVWRDSPDPDQPTMLVCTEVIEHCFNPQDVVHTSHKAGVRFNQIVLSVPLGCLYGGLKDWDSRRIGHVRGWTPDEFLAFANKGWPGYQWTIYRHHSMVIHGVLK
jgi:hypothetical protein